jgi:hypothetical protein
MHTGGKTNFSVTGVYISGQGHHLQIHKKKEKMPDIKYFQLFLFLLLPLSCSFMGGQNYIYIEDLYPIDSSDVSIFDTITAEIEYEYDDKYKDAGGVPLVLELLCGQDAVGEEILIDTLTEQHASIDVVFNFAMFSSLCEYSNRPSLYAVRLKLILGKDGNYDRVIHSQQLRFFISNSL